MALSPDRVHLSRDDDDDVSTRYSPPERQTGSSREPGGERSVRLGAAINIKDIRNMQIRSYSTDYIIMDLIKFWDNHKGARLSSGGKTSSLPPGGRLEFTEWTRAFA